MMKRRSSIFTKLFFTYLFGSFAAFLVFVAVFYLLFSNDLKQDFTDALHEKRHQVEQTLQLAYEEGQDKEAIISTLNFIGDFDYRSIFLFGAGGELLYNFSSFEELPFENSIYVEKALKGESVTEFIKKDGKAIFFMATPLNEKYNEQVMLIALHGYEQTASRMKGIFLLAGFITVLGTTLFLFIISKRIAAPLRDMNSVALEYAKGNFDKKVTVKSKDEVGQLGNSLNYMAKELESLDSMRKEFVANVSHDMRSPLTSVNGFIVAMLDGTIPEHQHKRYLRLMKDETTRLIKLVNDLLDIASIEAGQMAISPINYNLSEQVRKLIAKTEPELTKGQIEVSLTSNQEEDIFILADPNRIDQVLGNLMQNAINFSPEKGMIEVEVAQNEQEVTVSIKDEGPGLREEEMKFIWDRFFKVDKARSQKSGTGIGLSIVKHIIDLHGAKIEVDSKPGVGTKFTIFIGCQTPRKVHFHQHQ